MPKKKPVFGKKMKEAENIAKLPAKKGRKKKY